MKYRTKSMRWGKDFWKIVFNKIFGGISGYGTRPLRVALWCIVTFLVSAVIYDFTTVIAHLKSGGIFANIGDSLYFSAITFLTIGYSEIMPSHWLIKTISSIEGFMGLLLMSVLAVTIMRKVLR